MRPAAMLQFDDPTRPLDPALLDARGGFAWWYVDALDDAGNGLVAVQRAFLGHDSPASMPVSSSFISIAWHGHCS